MGNHFGRYFDEFTIGEIIKHSLTKTVTESDNNLFCLLTMNHHPIHLNKEYAEKQQFKRVLVVGTYVLSLIVGISVQDISGKAIANLDYDRISHDQPVFIGDTLHAETEILQLRESKTKVDRGIIFVETRAYNQRNEKVLTLRRHVLIPKNPKKAEKN